MNTRWSQRRVSEGVRTCVMAGVMIAVSGSAIYGQSDAAISGTVTDSTRSAIPGTSVTARSTETGVLRKASSDGAGHYELSLLTVGTWEITAEKNGFQTQVKKGVTLVLGERASVDFTLPVGAVSERVEITEQAAGVETTTADTSGLVGQRQVKELP